MPRSNRPTGTGYERLAQADQFSDDSDDDPLNQSIVSLQPAAAPRYAAITQPRPRSGMTSPKAVAARPVKYNRRARTNSGVDLKAINARLERWADEIAAKFKRGKGKRGTGEEDRLEIHHSVFQAPEGVRPATAESLAAGPPPAMSKEEFEAIVDSVKQAIQDGLHPRMISQGSSGSYFARNREGDTVGVFKPKDEEPYAAGNPKWNKWIHRNLFPCCFGRACLIPNLSYVSEAAAYVLDCQLRTHMVPYTDVIYLSSKAFHYPFWDRHNYYRKKKPLPPKPGSFQVFLQGFKDANVFLRQHPWPDQYLSGYRTNDSHRKRKKRWTDSCRPSRNSSPSDDGSDDGLDRVEEEPPGPDNFVWTQNLKQSFREELEKLVILDYIMRNTDRGLDNWMIKVDWEKQQASIASEPVQLNIERPNGEAGPRPVDQLPQRPSQPRASYPYKAQKPMDASGARDGTANVKISLGAIDNSLSWPWKHPDAWRSFPFGWLFLPVDLIGRPFSQATRDHFLPLLTSTQWWSQTQLALRRVFQIDPDFQERMFLKQIAVMKGQAWNVVETLKTHDHGPLELTRRTKVCVWDDLVDVPVALPMRVASAEMRQRDEAELQREDAQDEMDLGASMSSPAPNDLLAMASPPPADMPHPGRFELASEPASPNEAAAAAARQSTDSERPRMPRTSMASYAGPAHASQPLYTPSARRERRYSFAAALTRRNSNSIAHQLYYGAGDEEDLEGDLGYAAAEGMEGNRRKVIVERLEPVKARNPVFTWC